MNQELEGSKPAYEYSSMNSNGNETFEYDRKREKHPYGFLSTILTAIPIGSIIFVIVFGNALVTVAVLRDSQLRRQAQNWLIVSLAVADLLVGLLIMPLTLTYELLDEWTLGSFLCELWLALDVLFVTASILNLCAISLDRYWSLTTPTSYPQSRTPRRMFMMIMVAWLSAFAISFPPLVGWRPEGRTAEDCVLSDQLGYVLYSAFGSFYIPVSVLLFVYARIYMISRRRKRSSTAMKQKHNEGIVTRLQLLLRRKRTKPDDNTVRLNPKKGSQEDLLDSIPTNGAVISNDYASVIAQVRALATLKDNGSGGKKVADAVIVPELDTVSGGEVSSGDGLGHVLAIAFAAAAHSRQGRLSDTLASKTYELQRQLRLRRKLVRRRERQAILVLGLVLGSFVISWLPFFTSYVLAAVCCKTPDSLFDLVFWLGYCNSAFNPFIYNFFNRDFRRAFRRILCDTVTRSISLATFSFTQQRAAGRRPESIPIRESERQKRRMLMRFSSLDNEE